MKKEIGQCNNLLLELKGEVTMQTGSAALQACAQDLEPHFSRLGLQILCF